MDHFGNVVGDAAALDEKGDPTKLLGSKDRCNFWLPAGPVPLPLQDEAAGEGGGVLRVEWIRKVAVLSSEARM